jgi:hypothetical protein
MTELSFFAQFRERVLQTGGFVREIDALLGASPDAQVRAVPFYSASVRAWWSQAVTIGNRRISPLATGENVGLYEIEVNYSQRGEPKRRTGDLLLYHPPEYPEVSVAVTLEDSDFFRRAVGPIIFNSYPKIMTTFISHKRLRRVLDRFADSRGVSKIVIKRASVRVRYGNGPDGRHIVPIVSWPDMTLEEAFDWVHGQNGWFQSLSFDIPTMGSTTSISFSRQGEVRTTGVFPAVFSHFVEPVCKMLHDNVNFFQKRSRRETPGGMARPLMIRVEDNQFEDVAENERFIGAVRKLPKSSVSVLHGNPYIHISVLDYYDGSSFDVWVVSNNRIVVVPQFRGSLQAIKRLVNHIFDTYAEGQIEDYTEAAG